MEWVMFIVLTFMHACNEDLDGNGPIEIPETIYTMPDEREPHEGTWLQWPHHYQYGTDYRDDLDPTWIAMTEALVTSEKVHIIAYNKTEQNRIIDLLKAADVVLDSVDFFIYPTDDVWVRDNGPIYVKDAHGNTVIQDWGFNGWGAKIDEITGRPIEYAFCNAIPARIAHDQNLPLVNLNSKMVNEGGSVVIDSNGTLMACKSSILNDNRNPGMTITEAEKIFTKYLGVTHFIWMDGQAGLELTDQHIDGYAVFGDTKTMVTMSENDLLEYDVMQRDIDKLYSATNSHGDSYDYVLLPLTHNTVKKTDGSDLGYKGSYINYYIANKVVLVPNYNDPNDTIAHSKIQDLYPKRKVVGIDVRNLYQNGGMVHCVTQQQPK